MESKRSWEFSAIPIVLVLLGALAIVMAAFDAGLWACPTPSSRSRSPARHGGRGSRG
jgi:hypothetical protein